MPSFSFPLCHSSPYSCNKPTPVTVPIWRSSPSLYTKQISKLFISIPFSTNPSNTWRKYEILKSCFWALVAWTNRTNPFLLSKPFPSGSYAPAVKENFAMCFNCHKSELMEKPVTTTATGFRNGDKNLHAVHINGEKGRSCVICHNPHGATNDHLINDKTTFGNWEMPIRFKPLENGGSCQPGCHAERKYERITTITK